MILEILLIAAIIGIFIIVARRLPEALREGQSQPAAVSQQPASPSASSEASRDGAGGSSEPAPSKPNFLGRWLARAQSVSEPTEERPTPTVVPTLSSVSDESLLLEGDQFLAEGKLREAERSFLRAVAKNPKNPKLYNRLGAIYLKQRNFSDALEAFVAARELDASKASRHYNVALAAWQSGKRPLAREAIAEALSLDPTAEKYLQLKKEIEG